MVAFDKGRGKFNYRVAGVALHNGSVLLDRNSRNAYWVLPGGHPEFMESMADALRRELYEEIGEQVQVTRLLWVMENFFFRNKEIHELSFYFLVDLPPSSPLLKGPGPFYGQEYNNTLTFQWFPIDEQFLRSLPLYPGPLASALLDIPSAPQHIVFHDERSPKSSPNRLTI
jgi:8-oxo-dGTP pyrophosphatase MutT (NUDIX family)